jgi:hypothetical protein
MEKLGAAFLTGIQKSYDLDIHEGYAFEVQRDGRLLAIDPYLQFIEMLRLQPAAETDDCFVPIGFFFNPQCHQQPLQSEQ